MSNLFGKPDYEKDKELLKEQESKDQKNIYWRPKEGAEVVNVVRILPPMADGKGSYHVKGSQHFIKHDEDGTTEQFTCNRFSYGTPCPACETWDKLKDDEKARRRYSVNHRGVFQIIDRENPGDGPKLWFCPTKAVWQRVLSFVNMVIERRKAGNKMAGLFDEVDEKGNIVNNGKDLILVFDNSKSFLDKYHLEWSDPCPLGTEEEQKLWASQMIDLTMDNIFPEAEYEMAHMKTFGSAKEREILREELKKMKQEELDAAKEKEETETKEEKPVVKAPEPVKETPKEEVKKEEPVVKEEKPDTPPPASDSGMKKKIDEIKAKIKAKAAAKK